MKINSKQLQEIIKQEILKTLKENYEPEQQVESIVGVLELITDKILNFPIDNPKAVQMLPELENILEQIDGKLEKIIGLNQ